MILVDIDMPKSCAECPMKDDTYGNCNILPTVPYMWDVSEYTETRSPYCELKEYHDKPKYELQAAPEKCKDCENCTIVSADMAYCHTQAIISKADDMNSVAVNPDERPDWCPVAKLNNNVNKLSPDKREMFDMFAAGLSALLGS